MSWDNYGSDWYIDHKIPDSWSLNNLQPMWAKDNLAKGNRYESL